MHHIATVRRLLARRPWIYWMVVVIVAGAGAATIGVAVRRVEMARAEWGETTIVLVTTRDVAVGEPLAGLTAERRYPVAVVPPGAVGTLEDAAAARHTIAAGEVVVTSDVAASGAPTALIPPGWVGVAIAKTVAASAAVGDHVVVAAEGARLADDALVVGGDETVTIVAVPDADGPAVAAAGATGGVALLLRP